MFRRHGEYSPTYTQTQAYRTTPSSSYTSKCDKNFLKTDKTLDLEAIKEYNIKMDDKKDIDDKFTKYKNSQKKYSEKKGFIFRTGCKEYLEYEKDESRLNSNKRKKTIKYSREISNCKTYKTDEAKYLKEYMSSLSKGIKSKLIIKLCKTLRKPKDKRIKRFACYVKLLIDISNSVECRGNSISISNIISKFYSLYKSDNEIKHTTAKLYLEYLLTNKTLKDDVLKNYRTLFSKDEDIKIFTDALQETLKSYSECR